MTVEELILKIRVQSTDLKGLDRFERTLSRSRDLVNQLGRRAARATAEFVKDSIDNYRQFEKTMTSVRRIGQLTEEEFDKLEKMTRQVARGLGSLTASQLAEIETVAAQLGIQGAENIVKFSEKVGKGVLALDKFNNNAEKLATHMAKQKVIFQGSIKSVDGYMSVLNALSNMTAVNELELSNFNLKLGELPQIMKLSQAEATAWGSVIQESGVVASKAATGLKSAWTELIKTTGEQSFRGFGRAAAFIENESKDAETAIASLAYITGKSRDEFDSLKDMIIAAADVSGAATFKVLLQQLSQIESETALAAKAQYLFGTYGAKSVLPLVQNYKTLQERILFAEQTAAEGAKSIEEAYRIAMESGTAQFDIMASVIDDIQLIIGGTLVPALAEVAKTDLTPMLEGLSDWLQNSKEAQVILTETIPKAIKFLGDSIKLLAELLLNTHNAIKSASEAIGTMIGGIEEGIEQIGVIFDKIERRVKAFIDGILQAYQKVTAIYQKVSEKVGVAVEGPSPETSTEVENRFKESGATMRGVTTAAQQTTKSVREIAMATREATRETENMADVAYRHSVYPELRAEIAMTTEAVKGLQGEIEGITIKLQQMTQLQSSIGSANQPLVDAYKRKQQYREVLRDYEASHQRMYSGGFKVTQWQNFQKWLVEKKPEFLDLFQRFGTTMPSLQTGGYVPTTGPAYLHQGEYVLNKQQTQNMRNTRSGGVPIIINISGKVIDRQAFQQFTRDIGQELKRQGALRVGG